MADDPNPALRAELNAALAVIEPQIRGLEDLLNVSLMTETKAVIAQELDDRNRRRFLIVETLRELDETHAAHNRLEQDGYPALPPGELTPDLMAEIEGQKADFLAAFEQLVLVPPVTTGTVTISDFQDVPETPVSQ